MISRIGRRRTFSRLRSDGRRVRHGSVRLNYLRIDTPEHQVAYAFGRSFGNAVERNRGRRRLRAAFIEVLEGREDRQALTGAFLLTGSRGVLTDRFEVLKANVEACLDKLAARSGDPLAGSEPGRGLAATVG